MPDRLRIVPLAEQHCLPCATLMAASEPWLRYGITPDAALALWRKAQHDGAAVSVAHLDAQFAGFAWYMPGGGFGLSGYLKLLGVSAGARGRGVGTALLAHTESRTLADGQDDMILLVSDFNDAAQRFYRRHGYQQVGSLEDYVVPGIAELIYRKRLRERGS
jgi:ribosomal protein S18 acetylase RimI-like enzyme